MKSFYYLLAFLFPLNTSVGQNTAKSLEIGNKWVYFIFDNHSSNYYLIQEVIKDTNIDQQSYAVIKSISDSSINFEYQRADSLKIYRYIPSGFPPEEYPAREDTLVDFSLDVGDSINGYVVRNIYTDNFYGLHISGFYLYLNKKGLFQDEIYYARGIGIISDIYLERATITLITSELKAVLIEGVIWGASHLVNVEKEEHLSPSEFIIDQNYPNPFNPVTTIKYSIPNRSKVTIKVFDLLGREIATLVDEEKSAGNYKVEFNGVGLPSGIYFYRMETEKFSETKKLILLK
ncbi:MAG: T9SS type A sorting domain-containing protein [Ignavibacteria bacterium]